MKKYHYGNENLLIYSKGSHLCVNNNQSTSQLTLKGVLPDSLSLIKRALRSDIHNAIMCEYILIVVLKGKLLFFRSGKLIKELTIDRGSRPLRYGIACLGSQLFYGDYWMNPDRVETNIYKVDLKTFKKEIYFSFDHIQHIHFIQKDNLVNDSLLIGTGDSDSESGIYQFDIKTKQIKTILEGSQKYRVVSVIQDKEYLIWGTDAPNDDNYIYRFNRQNKELECLKKIDGPAYYSTVTKRGYMYIATTIEDRVQHRAVIYESKDNGSTWSIYKEFKKDIWHYRYFGYGIIEFMIGQEYFDKLLFHTIGLKEKGLT